MWERYQQNRRVVYERLQSERGSVISKAYDDRTQLYQMHLRDMLQERVLITEEVFETFFFFLIFILIFERVYLILVDV